MSIKNEYYEKKNGEWTPIHSSQSTQYPPRINERVIIPFDSVDKVFIVEDVIHEIEKKNVRIHVSFDKKSNKKQTDIKNVRFF